MRINNNLMAMNTHRQLGTANAGGAKSMEKLSSGFRINRAGDDAAGLAISEKMRGQIRGLTQASRNAQDGISLIQTAEGALNETHAILQRMRELAVQSSTDTNTGVDRAEIQKEVDQLAEEITRIAETTEFNTQGLLNGEYKGKKFHIGANEGQDVTIDIDNMDSSSLNVAGEVAGKAGYEVKVTTGATMNGGNLDNVGIKAGDNTLKAGKIDQVTVGTTAMNYALTNEEGKVVAVSADGNDYALLKEATNVKDLGTATVANAVNKIAFATGDKVISGEVTFKASTVGVITDIKATASLDVEGLKSGEYTVELGATAFAKHFGAGKQFEVAGSNPLVAADINSVLLDKDGKVAGIEFASGATAAGVGKYYAADDIDTKSMTGSAITDRVTAALLKDATVVLTKATAGLGTDKYSIKSSGAGIDVSTQETASASITTINDAITTVSAERSKLGAMQNRLEHTIKNLDTSSENLQASEARIRDVDMAKEMMEHTKMNILSQAATAMLAQANQAPQQVLQLLR